MAKPVNILEKATITDFKKAYKETGYTPCSDTYISKGKKACPAGVLYISKFGVPKGKNIYDKDMNIYKYYRQIDSVYLNAFTRGVDNYPCIITNNKTITAAYNKGLKVAHALGLTKNE